MLRRFILFVFLLPLTVLAQDKPASAPANTWTLEQLMQQRAQVQTARASFSEIRRMPSAEMTEQSSGILIYRAPDRLERQTLKPSPQQTLVENDRIVLDIETAPGKTTHREFALADIPGLRPFFAALRAVLAGDNVSLQRTFKVQFDGDENNWRMTLVPRERADQHVLDIKIAGSGNEIASIELQQRNGDSSRTTLIPESVELKTPPTPTPAGGS